MIVEFFKYTAITFTVYTLVPTAFARFCNLGIIRRLPLKDSVVITFDDGPDPRYTPKVLDVLKTAGVKACFFVVGEKALKHPEIIKKILSEGHEIGSHGFGHRISWLLGPLGTLIEITKSFRAIKEITGSPPVVFRPPWGLFNLSHYITRPIIRYETILWSFMAWDWTKHATPEVIVKKFRKNITDGSILIFHDSDTAPGASAGSPEKMICALPEIIKELNLRGYKAILFKDYLRGHKTLINRLFFTLWKKWDLFLRIIFGINDIVTEEGKPTFLRTSLKRYLGPAINLPDGKILHTGRKICELHLNNDFLLEYLAGETRTERIGIRMVRELSRSLPVLANQLYRNPRFQDADFLVAVTMLHRGTVKAGFTTYEIPFAFIRKLIKIYQGLILHLYHPSGNERAFGRGSIDPKIIAMSKTDLFLKYLK